MDARLTVKTDNDSLILPGIRTIIVPDGTLSSEKGGVAVIDVTAIPIPDANTVRVDKIAGEILGGNRAVRIDTATGKAVYADNTDTNTAEDVIGITRGAAILNATVTITLFGEMTEGSWAWTPGGIIYLSTTGQLTQTPPVSGALIELGVAETATSILIRIQRMAILA